MAFGWTFFRDHIVIGDDFANELNAEIQFYTVPPGTTLLIAARDLEVTSGYHLKLPDSFSLVLAADTFTGAGLIDVSGQDRPEGDSGGQGVNGTTVGANGGPGGPGGHGGNGKRGGNAQSVTILCRQLADIHMAARGGSGGKGGTGGEGGAGSGGQEVHGRPEGFGGKGGNGGNGGDGGDGGNGGIVTIVYMDDKVPRGFNAATALDLSGGSAGGVGDPGPGGSGGSGNPDGPKGKDGSPGTKAGVKGSDGSYTFTQVDDVGFWNRCLTELQIAAKDWASFRLRVGDFYFRSFKPNNPQTSNYLTLAFREFNAVLGLDPGNPTATTLRSHLLANQNVLGMARDYDLIPDFEYYEKTITAYAPLVQSLVQTSNQMLLSDVHLETKRQALTGEIDHIGEQIDILTNIELPQEQIGLVGARADLDRSTKRVQNNQAMIDSRKMELEGLTADPYGNVAAIITGMTAAFKSGSALPAGPAFFLPAWTHIKNEDLIATEEGGRTFAQTSGGLDAFVQGAMDLISQLKVFDDTQNTKLQQQYKDLLAQTSDLNFEASRAALRFTQAQLGVQAVQARIALAKADLLQAKKQLAALSSDIAFLGEVARNLMNRAQGYMDIIIRYIFWAARALEIYTLTDMSAMISYDYGHIHPDKEEDAYALLARGDASHVISLLAEYSNSWSRLPNVLDYRNLYDSYFTHANFVGDMAFVTITDSAIIGSFRKTADIYLDVALSDLPPSRYEAKTVSVYVSLVGAKAASPAITCMVEHSGQWSAKRRDGSIVQTSIQPRVASVLAAETAQQYSGVVSGQDPKVLNFWGRGPDTVWHLFIEPFEMTRCHVDVSGLTAIHFNVGYDSFYQ